MLSYNFMFLFRIRTYIKQAVSLIVFTLNLRHKNKKTISEPSHLQITLNQM